MTGIRQMSDLQIKRITSRLAGCTVGCDVRLFETLESTMDAAKRLAENGAHEGTVVLTEEQTAGRGRFDRSWMSEPGEDLLFSVVFRPDVVQAPYINMAAALSVRVDRRPRDRSRCIHKVAQRRETGGAQGFGHSGREHGDRREYRVHRSRRGTKRQFQSGFWRRKSPRPPRVCTVRREGRSTVPMSLSMCSESWTGDTVSFERGVQ